MKFPGGSELTVVCFSGLRNTKDFNENPKSLYFLRTESALIFISFTPASADEMSCTSEQTGAMTTSSSILYPKLHFSISLHKESGELHISIVEGNKHASALFLER